MTPTGEYSSDMTVASPSFRSSSLDDGHSAAVRAGGSFLSSDETAAEILESNVSGSIVYPQLLPFHRLIRAAAKTEKEKWGYPTALYQNHAKKITRFPGLRMNCHLSMGKVVVREKLLRALALSLSTRSRPPILTWSA